jgi:hypothetical protein
VGRDGVPVAVHASIDAGIALERASIIDGGTLDLESGGKAAIIHGETLDASKQGPERSRLFALERTSRSRAEGVLKSLPEHPAHDRPRSAAIYGRSMADVRQPAQFGRPSSPSAQARRSAAASAWYLSASMTSRAATH